MKVSKNSVLIFLFLFLVFIIQFVSINLLLRYILPAESLTHKGIALINLISVTNRLIIIITALFFIAVFIYSRKMIIGPLVKLEKSARLYGKGDSPFAIPKRSVDEINSLSRSILEMIATIDSQNEQIIREEKLASLGKLSAGMAHEINNPIGYMQSNMRSLKKVMGEMSNILASHPAGRNGKISGLMRDIGEMIEDNDLGIMRIHSIVESMKSFSRDERKDEYTGVDLNLLIRDTVKIAGYRLDRAIEIRLNEGQLPRVYGLKGQIGQVILNLLFNAGDAVPGAGGIIEINTEADGEWIYCRIDDNGPGVPQEDKGKIFDPFFTTKGPGEGVGMGLNVSYNIMKQHKGKLHVGDSHLGGASFTLVFPRRIG